MLNLSRIKDKYTCEVKKLQTERNVLRGEMAKHGVTVEKLADCVGISRYTLSKKINGKVDFSLSEIRKILAFFRARGDVHTVETLFDMTE